MLLLITFLLVAAFISWMYIFNIYEVDIDINRKKIILGKANSSIIKIVPLNSFGFKTPFRKIDMSINFLEGSDLAKIIREDESRFSLHAKSDTGKVILLLESNYFLYPNKFTFFIKPSEAT
jgi:hypothetical protein